MRLTTIRHAGATSAARLDGETLTVLPQRDVAAVLAQGPDWREAVAEARGEELALGDADLAPLVPRPEKILCVGLNYRAHIAESGRDVPDHPVLFAKFWRSLVGPRDDIALPPNSDAVDWEAELGVVIGEPVRFADEDRALAAIAGYTIVNDVSMRDWQRRTGQFLQGKTFEAATPLGPLLVTPDEVDHARDLRVTCTVDGHVRQDATTADLLFSPAQVVAYASEIVTLSPGDVIATGTPSGVGAARTPPVYLADGQTVVTAIAGLGEQRNRCVAVPRVAV